MSMCTATRAVAHGTIAPMAMVGNRWWCGLAAATIVGCGTPGSESSDAAPSADATSEAPPADVSVDTRDAAPAPCRHVGADASLVGELAGLDATIDGEPWTFCGGVSASARDVGTTRAVEIVGVHRTDPAIPDAHVALRVFLAVDASMRTFATPMAFRGSTAFVGATSSRRRACAAALTSSSPATSRSGSTARPSRAAPSSTRRSTSPRQRSDYASHFSPSTRRITTGTKMSGMTTPKMRPVAVM